MAALPPGVEKAPGKRLGGCPIYHPVKWSPETYLAKERTLKPEQDFHYQFNAQASSLSRRMYKEHGVGLQELQVLKCIYLLYMEKERAVSKINQEQELLLEKTGVDLSLC